MSTRFFFAALASIVLVGAASPAFAATKPEPVCNPASAVCVGKLCETIGLTTMDYDKKNILACLFDDSGKKVWKGMSQSEKVSEMTLPTAEGCGSAVFVLGKIYSKQPRSNEVGNAVLATNLPCQGVGLLRQTTLQPGQVWDFTRLDGILGETYPISVFCPDGYKASSGYDLNAYNEPRIPQTFFRDWTKASGYIGWDPANGYMYDKRCELVGLKGADAKDCNLASVTCVKSEATRRR